MSEGAPSKRLPRTVDARKLAHQSVELAGSVAAENLSNLAEATHSIGDIEASLAFFIDQRGKRVVNGTITASVSLICQRCMQAMDVRDITAEVAVAIVWNEDEARQLPADLDPWLVGEDEADLFALVEEELLLSLPVVAYHDAACIDPSLLSAGEAIHEAAGAKRNPFEVLEQLKHKASSGEN